MRDSINNEQEGAPVLGDIPLSGTAVQTDAQAVDQERAGDSAATVDHRQ
ncbi:MAG: hypothetical protein U5P41_04385 [Gammaproteobacteria bacterium]|nr:hypothetical protein [Gammaproteobacteria bacterium]